MFFNWIEFGLRIVKATIGASVLSLILTMILYWITNYMYPAMYTKKEFFREHKPLIWFPVYIAIIGAVMIYCSTTTYRYAGEPTVTEKIQY